VACVRRSVTGHVGLGGCHRDITGRSPHCLHLKLHTCPIKKGKEKKSKWELRAGGRLACGVVYR
jgi:hypothetical protein